MSNSPLVTYTHLSPNKTSPRLHKIDTITIHCVVGQVTIESLGAWFAKPSAQASSNYGIDKDGRIGLFVDEGDRSWCSGGVDRYGNPIRVNGISGGDNDHRAITIEVASDTYPPYKVTDKALNALVDLCTDICKRNAIPKLLWKGDKSLVGRVDLQNMTVHRWFAMKPCPGDYLYNLHPWIADEVNRRLLVEDKELSVTEAKKIIKEKLSFSENTVQYLWNYEYGDQALIKLARELKKSKKGQGDVKDLETAETIIKARLGYEDRTIQHFKNYRWGKEALLKIASFLS